MVNSLLVIIHIIFLYCSFHLHFFVIPTRKEMMSKLPDQIRVLYEEKVVFIGADWFYQIFDFVNAWWFIVLPAIVLILKIFIAIFSRKSEEATRGFLQVMIGLVSLILFFSLSLQILTVVMLSPNFYR